MEGKEEVVRLKLWRTVATYKVAEMEGDEAVVKMRSISLEGKKGPKAMIAAVKKGEKGRNFTGVTIWQEELYADIPYDECLPGYRIELEI